MNLLDLIYIPIGVLSSPWWARKKRSGWDERFGKITHMMNGEDPPSGCRVMIHAVSVGEINAIRALVDSLIDDERVGLVIVSASTDTGLARAQSLFKDRCAVVRYPLDASWMVRRFLDIVRPDVIGLVELEVWPNFIKEATKRAIPIAVINGRLSARSFKGYRKIRFLLRKTFGRLAIACVQDEDYADRFRAMGVASDRVRVTDSMKWDSVDVDRAANGPSDKALAIALELGLDLTRPIVVAGSTAPDEEDLLHRACPDDVQLICAPRKPERFDEAAGAMPGCVRRSVHTPSTDWQNRYLLDTIGELSSVYELADVVVVGRSFVGLYGSDPIEPAALGKPVVIGPYNSDFTHAIRVLQDADAIMVVDKDDLADRLRSLIDDPALGRALGDRARACVRSHQGATTRHHDVLIELAGKTPHTDRGIG